MSEGGIVLLLRMIVERKYDVSNVEKISLLNHNVIEVLAENYSHFIIDNLIFINTEHFTYQSRNIKLRHDLLKTKLSMMYFKV